ncbi:MAG: MBL fold metallo-hydrolase [Oscillospiraceae bacterium]|nr:MBL fold metallo-hydrolase [Oscillospiraceae bacterium]
MELVPVQGNTYVAEGKCTIPVYRLNQKEVVLLDSGYADPDRAMLDELFSRKHLRVAAVIGSHTHLDHSGNHAYFQKTHGAQIIMPFAEAAVASGVLMGKMAYPSYTPGEAAKSLAHLLVRADQMIFPEERHITVCGKDFDVLPLPGHTPGHTGIGTPDRVFYVGDALMSREVYLRAKLPTAFSYAEDLSSKRALYGLSYDRYILAHKGVYNGIHPLIGENIAYFAQRVQRVAALLQRPMSFCDVSAAAWDAFGLRTQNPFRISVFVRNLRCVLDYLCDEKVVQARFSGGVLWYERVANA